MLDLLACYRDGLLNDTLPFWIQHAVDREHGGFMTALDRDGQVLDSDKGIWQQARFTWLLAELYNAQLDNTADRREQWLELALHGARFIEKHAFDPADGRMWFHVTRDGRPIRKRRYAFSEAFAAIAFGELALATGDSRFAELAECTFQRFVDHNLYPPPAARKYTDTRPSRGIGFPMITINIAQELRQSIALASATEWIDRSIDDIRRFHVHPELECVLETVGSQGEVLTHFDGRTLNPGHAIEAAWFVMAEGRYRQDPQLVELGCQMLDWMWARGWDSQYGGILYFTSLDGRPIQEYWQDMKFWWPHNETIIATLMAFVSTGQAKYGQWHRQVHDWAYTHFPDAEHGEWFGYLHRDGSPSHTLKGNLWKGPFHLPRMQLICWQLADQALATQAQPR